ncbi:MAG: hypothetical protein HUU15_17355 [Candidatus Brocadiae bacterium]|nr:hypothetical protein [Candidatus Brocadiia bacterium]
MPGPPLAILSAAISDSGAWRWWAAEFPATVQIEFDGVQLWQPPPSSRVPPPSAIALRFHNARSLNFLTRRDAWTLPEDWPRRLGEERLPPLPVWHTGFRFNDRTWLATILREAGHVVTRLGERAESPAVTAAPVFLAFGAGGAACIVAAESLSLHSWHGELRLDEVPDREARWRAYWREYWQKRGTKEALPPDPTAEKQIPSAEPASRLPAAPPRRPGSRSVE